MPVAMSRISFRNQKNHKTMSNRKNDEGFLVSVITLIFTLAATLVMLFGQRPAVFIGATVIAGLVAVVVASLAVILGEFFGVLSNGLFGLLALATPLAASIFAWRYIWDSSRPPIPALQGIHECDKKKDFESKMICLTKKIEAVLKRAFPAEGRGMNEALDSAMEQGLEISEQDEKKFRKIASIRNRAVHEDGYEPYNVTYRELRDLACETLVSLRDRNNELGFLSPEPHGGKLLLAVRAVAAISVVIGLVWFLAGKLSG